MSHTSQSVVPRQAARLSGMVFPRLALPGVMLLAGTLRLWHLGDAGFGTEYYAAAVRSMMINTHNLIYNAFDPAGILMVDKPPLALWVQVLSARLLGFGAFALMLPQAIEGCFAVLLVWHLTRRDFGAIAGILAALFLAVTPISVAVDRSNNTDSLLVLVLLLAVWAFPRAGDRAAALRLLLAMALVGVGFNVKMAAALGVVPGFAAAYMLTGQASQVRRIIHLAAGGVALAVVSAGWLSVVALTPPADRPFVDSSASNSIFDLAVNHNAVQRFLPRALRRAGVTPVEPDAAAMASRDPANGTPPATAPATRTRTLVAPPGVARLADPVLASQALWLLPFALAGVVAMVMARRREAAMIWVGWAAAYAIVFSCAGGLFSPYYLVMLGPPLAVLAGVGVAALGSLSQGTSRHRGWLPIVLIVGLAWQGQILHPEVWDGTRGVLLMVVLVVVVLALGALLPSIWLNREHASIVAFSVGVISLSTAPAVWAVTSVAYEGGRPSARLERPSSRLGRAVAAETNAVHALLPFLLENRGGARFLAATGNTRLAAPLIIASGEPVVAFGGFLGSMPVLDAKAMNQLALTGALRFVILGRGREWWALSPETGATRWVRAHGTQLDPATIRSSMGDTRLEVFDLRASSSSETRVDKP